MSAMRRSSKSRPSAVRRAATLLCVIVLMAMCVINFVAAPTCMCLMDGDCTAGDGSFTSYGAYPRAVAIACLTSFAVLLRRRSTAATAYRRIVSACELYAPVPAVDRRHRVAFDAAYTALCLAVTLPVNLLRVYLLHAQRAHAIVVAFFVFMYLQNLGMCLLETRFVALCYALRKKFAQVNQDLEHLAEEMGGTTGPGPRAEAEAGAGAWAGAGAGAGAVDYAAARSRRVTYAGDFYGSSVTTPVRRRNSTANVVEIIRVRHQLVRDAVYALIDLFGVPMGMSLSALGVVSLFDIYYEVFSVAGADTRLPVFIYLWMLQYSIRFYAIVAIAHQMTKQGLKSKVLITDMNNRYLDEDTKEELQLFFSQTSSCSIEFTACDLFTLNMHLITSAIAAGTTFLVILLQLDL